MIPVSCAALWMVLTTCLERPFVHTGEPEYLSLGAPSATWIPRDRSWSNCGTARLYSPFLAADLAVAKSVAEGHEGLPVGGSPCPNDPEVGSGDPETLQGFIGAVWSGHPVDERCRRPRDRGSGRGCRLRRRPVVPAAAEPGPRSAAAESRSASAESRRGRIGPRAAVHPRLSCIGAEYR